MMEEKRKILIVDDNPITIKALKNLFEGNGYIVDGLEYGGQVYEKVVNLQPDLVIMDIMMPDIDGCVACEKIKNDSKTQHIPVMILTGYGTDKNLEKSVMSKADWYMTKPYDVNFLMNTVKKLIEEKHRG
ncbi:MAG: response regulator [Elusimicrobiota bacterium]